MSVVQFERRLYTAKQFRAGRFVASGTLCGHIDLVGIGGGTFILSPAEALSIIGVLTQARADVLQNSDPLHDPRLYDETPP